MIFYYPLVYLKMKPVNGWMHIVTEYVQIKRIVSSLLLARTDYVLIIFDLVLLDRTWDEKLNDPFVASIDAIRPLWFTSNEEIAYHTPGNVTVTASYINFFCGFFPKAILPLTLLSSKAITRIDLENVAKRMRNLISTTDEISPQKSVRYQRPPTKDQIIAINEAIRTANPLPIHLRSMNRSW